MQPGARLGPYEVIEAIGAGGMGEVWRARDTRLGRDVAIKILPPHVAAQPERRHRFEREARAVASLNHPNICALYDIGSERGVDYLVMELLDGKPVKGPLPLERALAVALEIAAALEAAHGKGVVHRDLKPGNILVTRSGAKLLDFGLAKTAPPAGVEAATISEVLTAEGVVMGTAPYMAPEQLRGEEADARTDIFAFGLVLYEMLTGRRAFAAATSAELIASILDRDPEPVTRLAPGTPPLLERILRRCIAKDPRDRWQSAGDVRAALQWVVDGLGAAAAAPAPRRSWKWVAAGAIGVWLAVFAALRLRAPAPDTQIIRFSFPASAVRALGGDMPSVSPDGRHIVYGSRDENGREMLYLRSLASGSAAPIEGSQDAGYHFWSPGGDSIAWFQEDRLVRRPLAGGALQAMFVAQSYWAGLGATWSAEGTILLAPENRIALHRLPEAGGAMTPVTALDQGKRENSHRFPSLLPDGRRFLYTVRSAALEHNALYVGSLDGKPAQRLMTLRSNAQYAAGRILFVRDGNLMAQPFDAGSATLQGEPSLIAENVHHVPPSSYAAFSASADGRALCWRGAGFPTSRLYWYDRGGARLSAIGPPGQYSEPKLSPDGRRILLSQPERRGGNRDIWMIEVASGVLSRFTFHAANEWGPEWSSDGRRVLFGSDREGPMKMFEKPVAGIGEEKLVPTTGYAFPRGWSRDGRWILYNAGPQVLQLLPTGGGEPVTLSRPGFVAVLAAFSPDSRLVAYSSNESGRMEIYVQRLPGTGPALTRRVSDNGGTEPRWSRDGGELFYVGADGSLYAARMTSAAEVEFGPPKALFKTCGYSFAWPYNATYDVAGDGRFLINCLMEETAVAPIHVIVNWTATLNRR
jgi:Tol biopolymer transport system component